MWPIETSKRYHSCADSVDTSTRMLRAAMQADDILCIVGRIRKYPNRPQANVGAMSNQWTNPQKH